jgi:hypothetical protein
LLACACLLSLEGCVSRNYQVSAAELMRLAQSPPAARGERVRVLQQTTLSEDEVALDASEESEGEDQAGDNDQPSGSTSTEVSVNLSGAHEDGSRHAARGSFGHSRPRAGASGARHGSSWGTGGGGGSGEDAIFMAIVAVVVANGVGIALAATEGRRFDGWARVRPDQPLVLITPQGRQWLPLWALSERDAASAQRAIIVDRGASVLRIDRAPLCRKGLAYEVELGTAALNTVNGRQEFGFASRTGIGYFPTQTLGLLFADQVAFGESQRAPRGGAVFNGRVAAELEYLPIRAGRLHAGFYTEMGWALVLQDLPDKTHSWSGPYAGAGFLAQVDWTTRLALNLRGGIAALPAHPASSLLERSYVPELTIGIAVY